MRPRRVQLALVVFCFLAQVQMGVGALKVLVYSPVYAASHSNYLGRLVDTLIAGGHDVTVLAPVGDMRRIDHVGVELSDKVIVVKPTDVAATKAGDVDHSNAWTETFDTANIEKMMVGVSVMWVKLCETMLTQKELIEKLRGEKFDVGILEPILTCGMALFEHIGIEATVFASSMYLDMVPLVMGEPVNPSYVPAMFSIFPERMTLWERLMNARYLLSLKSLIEDVHDREMDVYRRLLDPKIPHWKDLMIGGAFHLVNTNPYMDFARSTLHKTVFIGGISVDVDKLRSQNLSQEWDDVLSRRPKTVLISFGSMVFSTDMPHKFRSNLLDVFTSMPNVTIIWKYESDDVGWARGAENVVFSRWVPQTALLADERLTAFVTHGGIGSTTELAYLGKPAIAIPIFADQPRNAWMLERHGSAIVLDKFRLDDRELVQNALDAILGDHKYAKNAKKLADVLDAQPLKPKELVLKYTEFAARFGKLKTLDSPAATMSRLELYFLDAISIFCLASLTTMSILFICLKKLIAFLRLTTFGERKVKVN